jgi:RHS repeat-associated protein
VDGGSTATYAYDQLNQRYKKTVGATATHYIWQDSQVIAEHNGSSGAVLIDYVYSGSRMIAKVASGTTQYFLSDRLSARLVLDTSGNVLGRQAHLPFGEDFGERGGSQEKHHFTNYDRDSESGTDYAVNRQYAPTVGRFNRVDPFQQPVGEPQSHNRYAYVENDPTNSIDPLGLDACVSRKIGETESGLKVYVVICEWDVPSGGGPRGGGRGEPQPRVRPKPKPVGPAKFSEQKFRDCAHQLYDTTAGASIVDKFLDSRGNGTGPYQATFDYSMTAAQIGQMLYNEGITADNREQIAGFSNRHPDTLFFARDEFPSGVLAGQPGSARYEYGSAVLFHEMGNWMRWDIFRATPDRSQLTGGGYAQRNPNDPYGDSDPGAALEECMYGGFVHADGQVWNVPRGVPGTP